MPEEFANVLVSRVYLVNHLQPLITCRKRLERSPRTVEAAGSSPVVRPAILFNVPFLTAPPPHDGHSRVASAV